MSSIMWQTKKTRQYKHDKPRESLRECAEHKYKNTQKENERNYTKRRRPHKRFSKGDIVKIKKNFTRNRGKTKDVIFYRPLSDYKSIATEG